jgi:hypothetical protein
MSSTMAVKSTQSAEAVQKTTHVDDAERYMKQKKVYKIINELATAVLFHKPGNTI